jgi:hypothetical protein
MSLIRTPSALHEHAAAPLWIDLAAGRGHAWERARDNLVVRLNEHRDLLRQRLRRPVILLLPSGYRQRLHELAPDLWSIRDFSLDLDDLEVVRHDTGITVPVRPTPGMLDDRDTAAAAIQPATPFEEVQWLEWERLHQSGVTSREMLWAGWQAIDAALSARQLQRAVKIAAEVLTIARRLMTEDGDTPETVRDLSVSLDRVGDAAQALGRWEEAEAAYQEALILCRRLNLAFPDNAEFLQMIQGLEHKIAELHPSSEPTHSA